MTTAPPRKTRKKTTPTAERAGWRNRLTRYEPAFPIENLLANPKNWRQHPTAQRQAMTGVLDEIGFLDPIIAQEGTNVVIDGHLRLELAHKNGERTLPVQFVNLTDEEVARALLTFDPISQMATTHRGRLEELLNSAAGRTGNEALAEMLANLGERAGIVDRTGYREGAEDLVPAPPRTAVTQRGDLVQLGRHWLFCGDATSAADHDELMAGALADLLLTDPPYGVEYVGKTSDALTITNDRLGHGGTRALVAEAMSVCRLAPGGAWYVFSPAGDLEMAFRQALEDAGEQLRQALVWVKQQFVMGRQDYHWRHESILYGWREGAAHYFRRDRTVDTLVDDRTNPADMTKDQLLQLLARYQEAETMTALDADRPLASRLHPTMKPVALLERLIENSTRNGGTVLDPFVGSGSTLIAAERTNRTAYVMDIDPVYCDVAIERWQQYTGGEARRIGRDN